MADTGPVTCIGICGIGQMGAAAAVCCRRAGYRVILWGRDRQKLDRVTNTIDQLEAFLDTHMGAPARDAGRIERVNDLAALDGAADLVMDAIAEDMSQKVALFRRLTAATDRGALFITTTSGLSITDMGRQSGIEHLLVGTHFWNPPHLMPLVEVIRGADTPQPVIDRVTQVIESIGKRPVQVQRDVPGFIGNRLLHALWREAIYLVQQGIARPEDVDLVARLTFGLRSPAVGPVENMDLVGLDLVHTIHQYLMADLSNHPQPLPALDDKMQHGELGVKTGAGFYNWQDRDPQELIDRRNRQIVMQLQYLKQQGAL
ncbi:MAG: 3-hydroxyacyl-CoA dehydrogenase [Planctomycetaceae bacterium]|nr:3-hydroxyacyl-CoA dehydrogenase [Planctomycetaceae bacterium]